MPARQEDAIDGALALAVAGALHLGFQATVTLVVYPALADVSADRWSSGHGAHSRRIAPLVAVLYLTLLGSAGWAIADGVTSTGVVAVTGHGAAMAVTAALAAPTHGRLTARRDDALVRRLLLVDRMRFAAVVVGSVAGVLAVA